jgi:hypothetical protein
MKKRRMKNPFTHRCVISVPLARFLCAGLFTGLSPKIISRNYLLVRNRNTNKNRHKTNTKQTQNKNRSPLQSTTTLHLSLRVAWNVVVRVEPNEVAAPMLPLLRVLRVLAQLLLLHIALLAADDGDQAAAELLEILVVFLWSK